MTPTELSDRLLDFAADSSRIVDDLPRTLLGRHIAGQKSSTLPDHWSLYGAGAGESHWTILSLRAHAVK